MTRYAFFTTGFEYKFTAQESTDIELFGGNGECAYENGVHYWTADDRPNIAMKLKMLEDLYNIPPTRFDDFAFDYNGTTALRWELFFLDIEDESIKNKYILGCIIYHQLLYHCPLSADYDI